MLLAMGLFAVPLVVATAPGTAACFQRLPFRSRRGIAGRFSCWYAVSARFCLMNRWQREVTATEAGLVYCAEPVVVSMLALFLPGWLSQLAGVDYANEHVTVRLLLGGGLVTAANVLLQSRWLDATAVEA